MDKEKLNRLPPNSGDEAEALGFAGLLMAGQIVPADWQRHVDQLAANAKAQEILLKVASSPQGRAMLREQRAGWEAHGSPPPWEPSLGAIDHEGAE